MRSLHEVVERIMVKQLISKKEMLFGGLLASSEQNSDDEDYDQDGNHDCGDIVCVVAWDLTDGVDFIVMGADVDDPVDHGGRRVHKPFSLMAPD